MSQHPPARFVGKLSIDTEFGTFLGDARIRLLEAIARYGSISQAAKAVPISYKTAWEAIDTMNNLAESPVVESSVGGRQGGGTRLTAHGEKLVAMYRAIEQEYQEAMQRLAARADECDQADTRQFRRLLRRMSLRTSARNQFIARIRTINHSEVSSEVILDLDEGNQLTAVITRESAEQMELEVDKEVFAFIKASSVILACSPTIRTSARNHLWGDVGRLHEGPINTEVTLNMPRGRSVTAIITRDSAAELGLEEGSRVCAIFKASSVLLACAD